MKADTERVEIYNLSYPQLAPLLVHERLQWDAIANKNVWAHPVCVGLAFDALVQSEKPSQK